MADVELLPLHAAFEAAVLGYSSSWAERVPDSETLRRWHLVMAEARAYARANVAHATAAQSAEIETLRAKVERLTFEMSCLQQQYDERTAYMIVHRGSALACSDAMRAAYSDEHHRAERLAEMLRKCIDYLPDRGVPGIQKDKARALLREQEGGR